MSVAILHTVCGQTAFHYAHRPVKGERLNPYLITPRPDLWAPMVCGACQRTLMMHEIMPVPSRAQMRELEAIGATDLRPAPL